MWRCGEKTGSDFHKKIKAGGEIGKGRQKKQQQQQPESIGVQQLELCLIEAIRCCCVV